MGNWGFTFGAYGEIIKKISMEQLLNPSYAYVAWEESLVTGAVSSWKEYGGSNVNGTQATTSLQPTFVDSAEPYLLFNSKQIILPTSVNGIFNGVNFSVHFRINFASLVASGWGCIFASGPATANQSILFATYNGTGLGWVTYGGSGLSHGNISANTWINVTYCYDATAKVMTTYIENTAYVGNMAGTLNIGAFSPTLGTAKDMSGITPSNVKINRALLFNKQLTAADVSKLVALPMK